MKATPVPRGGLSVVALAIVVLVPLAVGWFVERIAYGETRAVDTVVAPLRVVAPASPGLRLAPSEPLRAETTSEEDAEPVVSPY